MKKYICLACIFCIIFSCAFPVFAAENANEVPVEIFVSLDGDDENGDGSIASPFATPKRARDEIRSIKEESGYPKNGIVVNFREGTYYTKDPIIFGENDGGEEGNPIVYRAYLNENVHITSAVELDTSKFTQIKSKEIQNKLPKDVRSKVMEMDISDYGVRLGEVKYLGISGNQGNWSELILNDERATWARYPNDDFLYTSTIISNGGPDPQEWLTDDTFVEELAGEENLFVYDLIFNGYASALSPALVKEDGTIGFKSLMKSHGNPNIQTNRPFWFVNSVKLIDTPGEYYIDRQNKRLYFYPPKGDYTLRLTSSDNVARLSKTNNVTFKNITFSGSQADVFSLSNSKNITFDGCTLRNAGVCGIAMGDDSGEAVNMTFKNGKIYDAGLSGINYGSGGNEEELISGNVRLYNNEIYHCGVRGTYQAPAIMCHNGGKGTVGTYVGYNHIHDMNSSVALINTEGVIEHNDIERVAKLGDDMGAIYWAGRYLERGRKINYNYIHDITCSAENSTHGLHGIYIDGGTEVEITNNVVADISDLHYLSSAMGLHTLRNNIFVGNLDNKRQGLQVLDGGWANKTVEDIKPTVPKYMYTSDVWTTKYPNIKKYLEKEFPVVMDHKIYNNVLYNCTMDGVDQRAYDGEFSDIRDNLEYTKDPGFVDIKNKNYQLKEDSDVYKKLKDFEPIDMTKIGTVSKNALNILGDSLALRVGSCLVQKGEESVMVDSDNRDVKPFIENGRTLVPVRFISEAFGMKTDWNEETREITLTGNKTIKMTLDKNELTVDGKTTTMDVCAKSVNGRTFIPLRSLSEALGKYVMWDERGLIIISEKENLFDVEADKNEIDFLIDKTDMY